MRVPSRVMWCLRALGGSLRRRRRERHVDWRGRLREQRLDGGRHAARARRGREALHRLAIAVAQELGPVPFDRRAEDVAQVRAQEDEDGVRKGTGLRCFEL